MVIETTAEFLIRAVFLMGVGYVIRLFQEPEKEV